VKGWVIPPKKSAAFVGLLVVEAVLDLYYEEPHDPLFLPVVSASMSGPANCWRTCSSRCREDRATPSAATTSTSEGAWHTC
jgi:hypothetical protein